MEIKFIPIDYDSFDFQGKNVIKIIGRNEKGKRVALLDSFEPYLWAILKQGTSDKKIKELQAKIEKIKVNEADRTTKVERIELHNKHFLGKEVQALKIFITNYKDAHPIADKLDFPEIEARREYDLSLITKYIIEKGLVPFTWFNVSGEVLNNSEDFGGIDQNLEVDLCIKAESIKKIGKDDLKEEYSPRVLAFDIEADEFEIGRGEILMISLVGKNYEKVLTWKKCPNQQKFVECFKDEAEMLEKFIEYVKAFSPDLLVGYYSDNFDMPYLRARAEKHKMRLSLGLDGRQPMFARGKYPSARVPGIVHVDLFRFIETAYSQYLQSETLGLNEVASELLGEGKKEFNHKHSSKINHDEWLQYFEYNLQDSVITYKLAEKIMPDMIEFSKIIQEPVFEITRNGMSQQVEGYILHNLKKYDEIAEKRPIHDEIETRRAREKYEGAFVFQPTPGLYEHLAMFDFTSMHASIIVTFNISKSTLLEKQERDSNESPEFELGGQNVKYHFSKKPGFFPSLLAEIVELRKKFKKELKDHPDPIKKARSNAYKLLANAYYGYLGFFGARYYSIEAAASTLAFVRKFNKETIDKANREGYTVIYADTDSVAFTLNKKTKSQVLEFLKKLNDELPGIMELELEDFYSRGIWVTKRTGEFGAKKKYALITEKNKLKIRGFETVRRDWCSLARELQDNVLDMILEQGNASQALKLVQKTIEEIRKRKTPKEELIIKTQLKKPIEEYLTVSPHVTIAKKMIARGSPVDVGMLIEFYIAEPSSNKKGPIRDRAKLPDEQGEYDIAYYLDHQIIPAVENIFQVFGISKEEILGKKQMKLGEF